MFSSSLQLKIYFCKNTEFLSSTILKNFLVAPLDWGLGHTSRCVPLIRYLLASGHKVVFAGNEWQIDFIYKTFPGIESAYLQGYSITYSHSARGFMPAILKQTPGILNTIRREHQWLLEICKRHHFDGIISDNRYGLYHPDIPSIIMTHQLQVRIGMGKIADSIFRRLHYKMLQRFGQCWVVDVPGKPNLGGSLSHPKKPSRDTKYIGLLSQFEPDEELPREEHLLVLLSGPEPQRSMLAAQLWQQLQPYKGKVVFVEGSNNVVFPAQIPPHIEYHKQLTKDELQPLVKQASMVICRSGYSTLMDLVALGKKAIIIPTPGQTEQEYLADHLSKEGMFYATRQEDLGLSKALEACKTFPFKKPALSGAFGQFRSVIDNWILSLPQ